MKQVLYIKAEREGYGIDQISNTMTVEELIGYLEQFDLDTPVYLKHDNGYTYGGIKWNSFEDDECDDGNEDDEDDEYDDGNEDNSDE